MYKIVIFDLDGTLANTIDDLADATNVGLTKAGLPTHPVEKYKQMVGSGIVNLVKRAMKPVEDEKVFEIVKNGFDEYYKEHSIDKTSAYEGTEELLNELIECGLELNKNEEDTPCVIETEEELENLIQAMRKAVAAPTKNVTVVYRNVTDEDEIKQIFN